MLKITQIDGPLKVVFNKKGTAVNVETIVNDSTIDKQDFEDITKAWKHFAQQLDFNKEAEAEEV